MDIPVPVFDLEVPTSNHNFCLGNGVVVHNSKDIADSVSGAVYNLYQNIDKAGQLSVKYKVNQYAKQIEDRTSQGKDLTTFQDMMQSIYGS